MCVSPCLVSKSLPQTAHTSAHTHTYRQWCTVQVQSVYQWGLHPPSCLLSSCIKVSLGRGEKHSLWMDGRRSTIPFLTHQSGPDRAPPRLIHPPASLALFFSPTLLLCLPRIVSIYVCGFFFQFFFFPIKSLWVRASKRFCCVNLAEKKTKDFPFVRGIAQPSYHAFMPASLWGSGALK